MANIEHENHLAEGQTHWNQWRAHQPEHFYPQLSRADLSDQDLSGYDLRNADLSFSLVANTDFQRADLRGAAFQFAKADGAEFTRAQLQQAHFFGTQLRLVEFPHADLRGALFRGTDLQNVNFRNADLRDSTFIDASLDDADLSGARLEGSRFTRSLTNTTRFRTSSSSDGPAMLAKPWHAHITTSGADPTPAPKKVELPTTEITSVADLIDVAESLNSSEAQLFYRGQEDHSYKLIPSVYRRAEFTAHESSMLRDLMTRRPHDFANATSALDQIVFARHHDLPTRLLDITENPLVSLYFACYDETKKHIDAKLTVFQMPNGTVKPFDSDTISIIANITRLTRHHQDLILHLADESDTHITGYTHSFLGQAHPRAMALNYLYQAIQLEKPSFQERINLGDLYTVFAVRPKLSSERIAAQKGAFLLSAFHRNFDTRCVERTTKRPAGYNQYDLRIPHCCKPTIRRQLRTCDITAETLLPSLDQAANAIIQRYSPPSNLSQQNK